MCRASGRVTAVCSVVSGGGRVTAVCSAAGYVTSA